jgi:Ca-activated chloride channel family protein
MKQMHRAAFLLALVLQTAPAPLPTFRSSVNLVRLAAVVHDHKGRFVQNLTAADFELFDNGKPRAISGLQPDTAGLSVALLVDISGSMQGQLPSAREAASFVLTALDRRDEAAVFRFDTRLEEAMPFTTALRALPPAMSTVVPFGATSLHDAIAKTAERAGTREGRRRAVVVFTDGDDNASRLSPSEVSAIASAIDVPVYIVGVVSPLDDPASETATASAEHSTRWGTLASLSAWTGGQTFLVSSSAQRNMVAQQIVEELRHQYLIAIESGVEPGWHRLVVKARNKDLTVRARSGYIVGQ